MKHVVMHVKPQGHITHQTLLVKLLLDTTLDPVLDAAEARNPTDPVSEILKLSIIDPACGSDTSGAAREQQLVCKAPHAWCYF